MERKSTAHRLKTYKAPLVFMLVLGSLGVIMFFILNVFENAFMDFIEEKAMLNLENVYQNDINFAKQTVADAHGFFLNSAFIAIIAAIKGFIMLFFFIRTGGNSKRKHSALNLMGLGGFLMAILYILIGFYLPESGDIENTYKLFEVLRFIGVSCILLSYSLFVVHLFKTIIITDE